MAYAEKICMRKGKEKSMSPLDVAFIRYMGCWYSKEELYDYIRDSACVIKPLNYDGVLVCKRSFQGEKYITSSVKLSNGRGEAPSLMFLAREDYSLVCDEMKEGD